MARLMLVAEACGDIGQDETGGTKRTRTDEKRQSKVEGGRWWRGWVGTEGDPDIKTNRGKIKRACRRW